MLNNKLPHDYKKENEIMKIKEQVANIDNYQIVADIFKQFSDTTRVRIFWLLCHCEECVTNISEIMEMSNPAVSHHLRPLKNSGLITSRRIGKEVYYKAVDTEESKLLHQTIEKIMAITCPD